METEHRITLADGRTLACLALGEPDGLPVMYFHGYPSCRLEARLAGLAAGRFGWRVIAPDRPGFGESTFQPGRTIGSWAADVAELADRFGWERFAIVGVSGGGPFALACAAGIPERVSRVILVGALGPITPRRGLTDDMMTLNRLMLAFALSAPVVARLAVHIAARWVRRYPERYIAYMTAGAPAADRRLLADAAFRTLIAESMMEALRHRGRGAAWELMLLARPWDFTLQGLSVPVQIWHGLADNIVPPAMARYLNDILPQSELHYLPDEGHLSLGVRHFDTILGNLRQ